MNCPICNKELQTNDAFCPQCGFEIHTRPDRISDAASEYEKTRETKYKLQWENNLNNQSTIKEQEKAIRSLQNKIQNSTEQNKDLTNKLNTAQNNIDVLNSQIKEEQEAISQFKKNNDELTRLRDEYKGQVQGITEEKDTIESKYNELLKEMQSAQYEISQLKSDLQTMRIEKKMFEEMLSKKTCSSSSNANSSTNANDRERKGTIEFSDGRTSVSYDIFSGNNPYTIPKSLDLNHNGLLFVINESNNIFTISDHCGLLKKANGRNIRQDGEHITNGDIFYIDSIKIKIKLPEIDLDNINF